MTTSCFEKNREWTLINANYFPTSVRFRNLFKRRIGCVTQRMLNRQLRDLETDGLVKRTVHAEVPPRVEYELTKDGKSLEPIIKALKKWGEKHAVKLLATRATKTD